MKAVYRTLALVIMLGLFSAPVTMANTQGDEDKDQPHMQAALDALKQAEEHLKMASHDKAGHRVAALKATQEAIKHCEAGMKAGEKHEDHGKK